jgi:hypothetical protein
MAAISLRLDMAEARLSMILVALTAVWTALAAAGGYVLKTAFDNTAQFQEKADEARDQRALALEEERLRDFWWPIYLRLQLDTAVWSPIAGNPLDPKTDPRLARVRPQLVDKFLLPNHDEVVKILETKFYLGKPDMTPELETWFLDYINHVAIYHGIRELASGRDAYWVDKTPYAFGRPWPGTGMTKPCPADHPNTCFVDAVRDIVIKLQDRYDQHAKTLFRHVSNLDALRLDDRPHTALPIQQNA